MRNTDECQAGRKLVANVKLLALLLVVPSVIPLPVAAAGSDPALFRTVKALADSATGPRHQIEISREAAQASARSGRLPVVMPDGTRFEAEVVRTETSANGVWTLVYTAPVSNNNDILLSSLPSPLASFSPGTISGVRLSCTQFIGNCYHSIDGTMQFSLTAGVAPSPVPTLSEYALIALMLGVMAAGVLAVRGRRPRS